MILPNVTDNVYALFMVIIQSEVLSFLVAELYPYLITGETEVRSFLGRSIIFT